jgi:thiamine pyrophosphokinase
MDETEFPNPDAWGDLDWLSEEGYNRLKEKTMTKKKKKKKIVKKKKKTKKKRK